MYRLVVSDPLKNMKVSWAYHSQYMKTYFETCATPGNIHSYPTKQTVLRPKSTIPDNL